MNKDLLSKAKDLAAKKLNYSDWFNIDNIDEGSDYKGSVKASLVDDVAIEYEKLLRIGKTIKQRRDYFAGCALQALISKLPLFDNQGTVGKPITDDELQIIKSDLTKTAWGYADWLIYNQGINSEMYE